MRMLSRAARKPAADQQGRDLRWRFIDRRFDDSEDPAGPAICSRCHAYLEEDHWLYNEHRYRELKEQPDINVILCPGCTRVEKRIYEGEVIAHHRWDVVDKGDVMNLIHNEEARARATNPTARIALMEDRGDELYILTTTEFLAKRIGRELQKAYRGSVTTSDLPRERFVRVRWARD
ncbi:MAG TPA: hypothetical protein VHV83_04195 [Armatimonadota bacterium]|nr:hypothetical protein [Armatimonadota bacterium]